MTERQQLNLEDQKKRIFAIYGGRCACCGKPATQLAHQIPQTKRFLRKYGREVIHHRMNLLPVCNLRCNAKVDIGNRPLVVKQLVIDIRKAMK